MLSVKDTYAPIRRKAECCVDLDPWPSDYVVTRPSLVKKISREITEEQKRAESNTRTSPIRREFPIPLEQLSFAVYSVDWKELVNPFLLSKLCEVVGFKIEPEKIFGSEICEKILREYPDLKFDLGLPFYTETGASEKSRVDLPDSEWQGMFLEIFRGRKTYAGAIIKELQKLGLPIDDVQIGRVLQNMREKQFIRSEQRQSKTTGNVYYHLSFPPGNDEDIDEDK